MSKNFWIFLLFILVGRCIWGKKSEIGSISCIFFLPTPCLLYFNFLKAFFELVYPDKHYIIYVDDDHYYDLYGHGGMIFWFISSMVFFLVSNKYSSTIINFCRIDFNIQIFAVILDIHCHFSTTIHKTQYNISYSKWDHSLYNTFCIIYIYNI